MSLSWGDRPIAISTSSQSAATVRAASASFMASSTPMSTQRRSVLFKFVSGGDLVMTSGHLSPMDDWLADHQAALNSAAALLSDRDSLAHLEHPEKYLLRREHQPSEIVNRIRLYMSDVMKKSLSPETIPELVAHISTPATVVDSPSSAQTQVSDVIVTGPVPITVSETPARYDEEEYNAARGKFLTHGVADLSTDTPGLSSFIREYWETVPTSTNGQWDSASKTGLLIRAPEDPLDSQTLFSLSWEKDLLLLSASGVTVASFDVRDVSVLASEHQRNGDNSEYARLTSTKHSVVFFTPRAIRWMIDNDCSDSMVSPRHIRVCLGFDPVFARWTGDGVSECAMLMDDRLKSIGKQRMVKRCLGYLRDSPSLLLVGACLGGAADRFINQYSPSAVDRCGYSLAPLPHFTPAPIEEIQRLNDEIQLLKAKLSASAEMIKSTSQTVSTPSKLLSRISELTRQNKELLLRQSDFERSGSAQLLSYLEAHVCVNAKPFECDLLAKVGLDSMDVTRIRTEREMNRVRFERRLSSAAIAEMKPEMDSLKAQLETQQSELEEVIDQCLFKDKTISDLESQVTSLKEELRVMSNRAVALNAENHRLSVTTKTDAGWATPTDQPAYETPTRLPSKFDLVDEL
nr:nonstructural replication protein [Pteropine orthoreovirus]